MASENHRGWKLDPTYGLLAGVYNGAYPHATILAANTAANRVLVGTPVSPALAVNSMVFSNTVENGDLLFATNYGGNSVAWIGIDTSARTLTFYAAGVAVMTLSSSGGFGVADDKPFTLGTTSDIAMVLRSTILNANTALSGVMIGTPVTPAVAANSLILSNVTASGDVLLATNLGGNSQAWLWVDTSASTMTLYNAGVATLDFAAGGLTVNDGSADLNFTVESNGMAFAIYSDGGKDSVVLGSNTDTSSVDQLINITRAARTATANVAYYDLIVAPAGAVTVPTGTTAIVATARFNEPNITATGTVTYGATVYVSGQPSEGTQNVGLGMAADTSIGFGTAGQARLLWETADANANALLLQLPTGGATDVPVVIIGQAIENLDLTRYNAVVDPTIAIYGVGAVTTGPILEFRKSRGTVTSPTVCTTGDDLGTINFYGAVAAGEYALSASIRADIAGTIATTRGPGTLTFLTAVDAGGSALTAALTLSAAQGATIGGALVVTTTSTFNGNLILPAGVDLTFTGTTGTNDLVLPNALADALSITDGSADIAVIDTNTAGNLITWTAAHSISGDLTFAAAKDIVVLANTAAALELSDGTTKILAIDTRNTVTVQNVLISQPASQTLPDGAASRFRLVSIAASTVTLAGATTVTTVNQGASLWIGAPTYNQAAGATTVAQVSTVFIGAPVAGASVTITANYMIATSVADCYLTGAGVWTDTVSTMKIKQEVVDLNPKLMPELIEKIRPVSFKYNPDKLGFTDWDRQRYGVIAEELPDFLRCPADPNPSAINGSVLGTFGLACIRYLHEQNKILSKQVKALQAKVAA
jgi:hypothetical protein